MEKKKPVFEIGDVVEIVEYGHILWFSKHVENDGFTRLDLPVWKEIEDFIIYDINKALVGQIGIVDGISNQGDRIAYTLKGPNKYGWYHENQMKLYGDPNKH